MAKIANYPVLNFSGGIRRDKSFLEMRKNELLDGRNIIINEDGRVIVRRGSFQVGQTLSNTLENSFVWERVVSGSAPMNSIYVNDNASTATIYRLRTTRLTAAITTASTTLSVATTAGFSASGTVSIEGDLIAYTGGGGGGGSFTGASGITSSHPAGSSVEQWGSLSLSTAIDGRLGVTYAVLNNILIICGRGGNWDQIDNDDAVTTTNVTAEPAGLYITNYRDRLYVVGDGSTGTNSDPRRVTFCARGDPTSWTATDFFDVEDQRGEGLTAQRVLNDKLLLFKTNSLWTYDEIELKQRIQHVGAWNNKVVQEVNGLIYTFSPNGIFVTNGLEAKQIGDPVRQYWKNFQPTVDAITSRQVTNTHAGKFEHLYILYIEDITEPDTTADVCLVYDTIKKAWTVFTGYVNFAHLGSFEKFRFGDRALQLRPALFAGDESGKYYRLFESRYMDNQSTQTRQGTDFFQDVISDTGAVINASFETPLYDLTHPELFKYFKHLRVYAERGRWNLEYRIEDEKGISAYRELGAVWKTNQVLPFPKEAAGWRCGFRVSNAEANHSAIFNGFIFEDTEVRQRT